ncbi:MAG: phosphomannomutase/phosphoglucomutase [Euryarchaeota archaeon]|nr:phosphomannomutase/phosphoglucomutase [Euryarchaeota archaeon]
MSVFKAYDIRGIAGSEIDVSFSRRLGRSIVDFTGASSIAVGRDIRTSGEALHEAMMEGIRSSGCDVVNLGIVPTGVVYRSTVDMEIDVAIAITASHNPPEYNGFKIVHSGLPMAGRDLQDLKSVFDSISEEERVLDGTLVDGTGYVNSVIEEIVKDIGPIDRRIVVSVDAANAVPGPYIVDLFEKLGVETVAINCEWNADFPAHPADPTRPANMRELSSTVVSSGAEFGIGVDGDGDRIGVVDENGRFIHPDRLIGLFAKDILLNEDLGKDSEESRTILYDVKCSMGVDEAIASSGGIGRMVRTGHSFMKRELASSPSIRFAGEMSGHLFFNDRWNGFDCSLYNSARLIELVARLSDPMDGSIGFSDLLSSVPEYPSTGESKINFEGGRDEIMKLVRSSFSDLQFSEVDGVRVTYPNGWFLCRPSNTEPILIMRAEGRTEAALESILSDVRARIGGVINLRELR